MNLQFYLEKLNSLENFQEFIRENPKAFFCSSFFVLDKDGNDNKQHFDFFNPADNKIMSFQLEDDGKMVPLEFINISTPSEMSVDIDFDFDYIERKILGEMMSQDIKNKIQKIIISMQKVNGKNFLVCTVFISGFGLVKVNIDLDENKITDFDKKSFFDMVKVFKKDDKG